MNDFDCGAAYVERLAKSHERLERQVREIERVLDAWPDNPSTGAAVVAEHLRELRTELERHFAEEAAGGCLEEAAARTPRLGPTVDRVVDDHMMLLIELERLIAACPAGGGLFDIDAERRRESAVARLDDEPPPCADVAAGFRRFAAQLRRHLINENQIARQGLGPAGANLEAFFI